MLTLFLALLPEQLGWTPDSECCQEACSCAVSAAKSCCDEAAGPVIVALCGCGESHGPRLLERLHVDWFGPPRALPEFESRTASWHEADAARVPYGLALAPEPPPPRRVG